MFCFDERIDCAPDDLPRQPLDVVREYYVWSLARELFIDFIRLVIWFDLARIEIEMDAVSLVAVFYRNAAPPSLSAGCSINTDLIGLFSGATVSGLLDEPMSSKSS